MSTLDDVIVLGSPALLTTVGPDGPRTRPVIVQPDPHRQPHVLGVLTREDARKVADVRSRPLATLAGTTEHGFFSLDAEVELVTDPAIIAPAMAHFLGAPEEDPAPAPGTCLLRLTVTAGQVWTVRSPAPFDNEVAPLEL